MRPTKDFSILYNRTTDRINNLRLLAQNSCQKPANEFNKINQEISYVTIELHTAYSNFARSYFLSCVIKPVARSGIRITCDPAITSFIDAIDASMKACKNSIWLRANGNKNWSQRDEPAWHQTNTLMNSCQEISCSNQANIINALSVPTHAFQDLTKFRNFFAHRNKSTMSIALNLASQYSIPVSHNFHPSKILCMSAYGRTQSLILDWIDDISLVIDLLCQ